MSTAAMPGDEEGLQHEGERITQLIDDLGAMGGAPIRRGVEELVRRLVHLYGSGLTRLMALLPAGTFDAPTKARLLDDALVSSLLLLHDAHPAPEEAAALDPGPAPDAGGLAQSAGRVQSGLVQIDVRRGRSNREEP
jgi:hypothetical protein